MNIYYNKILSILFNYYRTIKVWFDNISDINRFNYLNDVLNNFYKIIVCYKHILYKNIWNWKFIKRIKEYNSYKNISNMMYEELYFILKDWKDEYDIQYNEQVKLAQEEQIMEYRIQKARAEHITVKGFNVQKNKRKIKKLI